MNKETISLDIWENVWSEDISEEYIKQRVEHARHTLQYRKVNSLITEQASGLKVIELGCGEGIDSLLLGISGAKITCVDFSKKAISRARKIFELYGIKAGFVEGDIFNLPDNFRDNYDISISGGVAEHFLGKKRRDIFKVHLDVLKSDGLAIVAVPNAWCFPYRIMKYLMEKTNKWILGTEIPFSRWELINIAKSFPEVKGYKIFGGSFYRTFYTNLFVPARVVLGKLFNKPSKLLTYKVINEKSSIFDDYLGNFIVLVMKKV
jgi:2-polyprenyl-3-methyl-5-hydroxy-6-metoxy-1,4-benzoquinol methylase